MVALNVHRNMLLKIVVNTYFRVGFVLTQQVVRSKLASYHIVEAREAHRAIVDSFSKVATPEASIRHDEVETCIRACYT